MTHASIVIRPMREDEKQTVHGVMRQSFPLIQRWFFSWTPNVLVAERDGQVLGGTVLKLFSLPKNRKGGLIYWVFTAPEARGLGLGQRLVEAGFDFFEKQGCDEILACVEGFNTSSNKLFATRGFSILSPGQQFRRYGIGTLSLWAKIFHYIDVGHFVWARPGPIRPDSEALQWFGNLAMNALLLEVILWRLVGSQNFNLMTFITVPLMLGIFFGGREAAMRITANRLGFPVRYRAWESGFPLSVLLAFAFARWFPIPGSVYPTTTNWRYRDNIAKLGAVSLAGGLTVLTLSWMLWLLPRFVNLPPEIVSWLGFAGFIGKPLALFDIALPFFPFVSYNGGRLWDWNRVVWGVLALAAVALFLV